MPAYIQHHQGENAPIICPGCVGLLPMFVREVEPPKALGPFQLNFDYSDFVPIQGAE